MTKFKMYKSTGEDALFVSVSQDQLKSQDSGLETTTIFLDDQQTYQEMDGFGASFTDSSAYLINQVLSDEQRAEVMNRLFHPEEGIGLSVIRNPMGASDYARTVYSYNDLPENQTDPELSGFSIAHDEADVIPLTQKALELNPELKLFASPWSAPGWMKTSGSMITGQLKNEWYPAYAEYFVKYIQAYASHGLPIHAVTPQNEALYEPGHYPGMLMPAEAQADFIKNHLKPALVRNDIQSKILCYDHNWDRPDYPLTVLDEAAEEVDGVAWHWYGGEASAQTKVYEAFAGKEVHFTEGSGGEWIPPFEQAFSNVIRTGIEILRNYSKSFVLWNMALDENNGPTVPGFGKSTCRGIVKVNQQTKELTYTLDYYALAHFSALIRPKAVRIDSSSNEASIRSVAFKNTDGSIALVLFNDGEETGNVQVQLREEELLSFQLESKSALSILINEE
ncbi:glycoside hydrolase family 30 beta sandwich domain-containing protein [Paenibacillus taichungensis]|uniref:glycoside hydrolase family 30 protein n=1 Tax=Paenibacillus taichungensis TaxID=484184 RepID=UPI002DB8B625|nr:glycoside hydrolase family 30 beta sandwich domain-containing protein [Paenibacillus taichungensis]MEC0105926.1 glycoside hydrolase family 30 beta sandwich domain-containing protein [Paenibacillus taichungensis]MEC0196615.1 glycoside hydrolase family 30 beta sandwich domain-containing protein [Paenibacillus taichungensis]